MRKKILKVILPISVSIALTVCAFQQGRCYDLQKNAEIGSQPMDELVQVKRLLENSFAYEIRDEQVRLRVTEKGLAIVVLSDVLFDSSAEKIRQEGFSILGKIADILNEKAPQFQIYIEGYTDNQRLKFGWKSKGDPRDMQARSVANYLVDEKGIPPARVSTYIYGSLYPIAPNDTEEGRHLNRRIEIVILTQPVKSKETRIPYDMAHEILIPIHEIEFTLSKDQDKDNYEVYVLYLKGAKTAESFDGHYGHYIHIYGTKSDVITVFKPSLYYNSENNILYIPFPGGGRRRYYILGKGEIINGAFKPYFLEGTKFTYHLRQHSQLDTSSITIHMPKLGYELLVEENN